MRRRQLLMSGLAATLALPTIHKKAWAQNTFPSRPLTVIVPWPAGAGTDVTTRAVAETLSRELGQPVAVENRAGANGAIGLAHAARVAPDGYTLATATADTHSISPHLRADLPYDAVDGFIPLAVYATTHWAWMARPDFPANNIKELIALAKQKPGQITYASWGIGSTAHIAGALLERATSIELSHVPFPGAAPATTALQGGHVDLLPISRKPAENLRKAGKVKIIATSAPARSTTVLPDVATVGEQGYPDAQAGSWYGISVRSGIPEDARARLQEALIKVLGSPEIAARINAAGMDPVRLHGEELKKFMRSEYERYGNVIREKGIKAS